MVSEIRANELDTEKFIKEKAGEISSIVGNGTALMLCLAGLILQSSRYLGIRLWAVG